MFLGGTLVVRQDSLEIIDDNAKNGRSCSMVTTSTPACANRDRRLQRLRDSNNKMMRKQKEIMARGVSRWESDPAVVIPEQQQRVTKPARQPKRTSSDNDLDQMVSGSSSMMGGEKRTDTRPTCPQRHYASPSSPVSHHGIRSASEMQRRVAIL